MDNIILLSFSVILFATETPTLANRLRIGSSDTKAHDVLDLIGKFNNFYGFQELLEEEYNGKDYRMFPRTLYENAVDATAKLLSMNLQFMRAGKSYVVQHLFEYFDLVVQMVDEKKLFTESDVRNSIGFQEDHNSCMLMAFYDCGIDVNYLVDTVLYCRTVYRNDRYPLRDLKYQMKRFRREFDKLKFKIFKPLRMSPIDSAAQLKSTLQYIERKIERFSAPFCASWPRFIGYHLNSKSVFYDVQNQSLFMYYVFNTEKCTINFERHDYEVESLRNRLTQWNCEKILIEWPEFEFQLPNIKPRSALVERVNELSLVALKDALKWNSLSQNILQYYNIASDIMLFISIKEGNKIIKGIKHVVDRSGEAITENAESEIRAQRSSFEAFKSFTFRCFNCSRKPRKRTGKPVEVMHDLRSTLATFKSIFDKFVYQMLVNRRIDIRDNRHKKQFDERADYLLNLLDTRNERNEVDEVQRIVSGISQEPLNGMDDEVFLGDNPIRAKFHEYYFTEPIGHIRQLYQFSTFDF